MTNTLILIVLWTLALSVFPGEARAQTPEDDALAVVTTLFDGMRTGDGDLLRSLFHPDAFMTGTGLRDGGYNVSITPPTGWIESGSNRSSA